jgi:tRNA(fMet)-specific endonuclease VapC
LKYLLDTNVISEFISKKPNQKVLDFVTSLDESDVYLSVITIGEIKFGIQKVQNQTKKEQLLLWLEDDLLQRFKGKIVDIDTDTMLTWGELNQYLQSLGRVIPIVDSLIASSCVAKDFTLITRNVKDFYNFDLKIINPFN